MICPHFACVFFDDSDLRSLACLQVVRIASGSPRTETPVRETAAAAASDERFGRCRWPRACSSKLETTQAAVFEEEGESGATVGVAVCVPTSYLTDGILT